MINYGKLLLVLIGIAIMAMCMDIGKRQGQESAAKTYRAQSIVENMSKRLDHALPKSRWQEIKRIQADGVPVSFADDRAASIEVLSAILSGDLGQLLKVLSALNQLQLNRMIPLLQYALLDSGYTVSEASFAGNAGLTIHNTPTVDNGFILVATTDRPPMVYTAKEDLSANPEEIMQRIGQEITNNMRAKPGSALPNFRSNTPDLPTTKK